MTEKPKRRPLRSLGSRLGTLPDRLGNAGETEAERARRRDRTEPLRKLYRTARWQRLRLEVLLRDGYTCRRCGLTLPSHLLVADHVRDHGHDPARFWVDSDGLQTLCQVCHGRKGRSAW